MRTCSTRFLPEQASLSLRRTSHSFGRVVVLEEKDVQRLAKSRRKKKEKAYDLNEERKAIQNLENVLLDSSSDSSSEVEDDDFEEVSVEFEIEE